MDCNSSSSTKGCLRLEDNCGHTMVWILIFWGAGGHIFGISNARTAGFWNCGLGEGMNELKDAASGFINNCAKLMV